MTITKEQFGEWRQHPATKFFWKFIKDLKQSRTEEALERFVRGQFGNDSHELRGVILALVMFEELTFDLIESFYQELNNATEGTETISR